MVSYATIKVYHRAVLAYYSIGNHFSLFKRKNTGF